MRALFIAAIALGNISFADVQQSMADGLKADVRRQGMLGLRTGKWVRFCGPAVANTAASGAS
jgi:hypothetical protein